MAQEPRGSFVLSGRGWCRPGGCEWPLAGKGTKEQNRGKGDVSLQSGEVRVKTKEPVLERRTRKSCPVGTSATWNVLFPAARRAHGTWRRTATAPHPRAFALSDPLLRLPAATRDQDFWLLGVK
ncbi:unnamed protein product [Caretta caretta]